MKVHRIEVFKLSISDEKFYAQRDANFKDRVYRILFDDPSGHSDQEVLELISKLKEVSK
tara:strand:- start:8034 stop:8210 length:177 start_codon:yes stop_codon:yes gene_type:complete